MNSTPLTGPTAFGGPHRRRMRPVLVAALVGLAAAPVGRAQSGPEQGPFPGSAERHELSPVANPKLVCFPPFPPPLDRPISHIAVPGLRHLTPSPELSAYVGEIFYPSLSTWLAERTLPDKLRVRLTGYRAEKLALQQELRAALDGSLHDDPARRTAGLEALARRQSPRLEALEQSAEQLRTELATSAYDWRALRTWTLNDHNARGDSPNEISSVLRAYAYYQVNLTSPQRRLLREIAAEIALAQEDEAAARAAQPYLFFSPEPARVMLPDDLPAELAAKVAAYQTAKSNLKKELFDTIAKQEGATFAFSRNKAIADLGRRQAAGFAAVERLADEIRGGLARVPAAIQAQPERSPLPPALTERIGRLLRQRATLQRDTTARLEAIRTRHAEEPVMIAFSYESEGLRFLVVPRRQGRDGPSNQIKALISSIEGELAAEAEPYGRSFNELLAAIEAVRQETGRITGRTEPAAIDAVLGAATRVAALRETEDGYREYRLAVFEPGLSPAQRRLLFDAALEKLDLPLPRGELQPTRRAASW